MVAVVLLHLKGKTAGKPEKYIMMFSKLNEILHCVETDAKGPHVHSLAVHHLLVVDLGGRVLREQEERKRVFGTSAEPHRVFSLELGSQKLLRPKSAMATLV